MLSSCGDNLLDSNSNEVDAIKIQYKSTKDYQRVLTYEFYTRVQFLSPKMEERELEYGKADALYILYVYY